MENGNNYTGYEYRTLKSKPGMAPPSAKQCTDEFGAEGWELVWGYHNPGDDCWYLYFKREL